MNIHRNIVIEVEKPEKPEKSDPQIVLEGKLKQGEKSDIIVFRMNFYIVELVFIVTVPHEGSDKAPVYVKFKMRDT